MKILACMFLILVSSSCISAQPAATAKTFDDLEYPFPVKIIKLDDGKEIAYIDEGAGSQTLLFVHGLGSYAPAWKKNIERLKNEFRCLAIDLPGYGKSSKGEYEASMTAFSDVLVAFLDKIKVPKVTLVGHSMGGQISIMTALTHSSRVEQLILIAPAGFETFTLEQKQWFRNILTPAAVKMTTIEQIKANFERNFYQLPDDALYMVEDRIAMRNFNEFDAYCYIIPACVRGMVDEPVFDKLDRLKQPTLVIFGEEDALIPNRFFNTGKPVDIAKKGTEKIPNATLKIIPGAGHFAQFEKAEQVNDAIVSFLK